MRVHIVSPYDSVAMARMTLPFQKLAALYDVDISTEMDITADVNIHCPLHTLTGASDYGAGQHIGIYTHCNPGAETQLYGACQRADIVTAMSFAGRQELLDYGIDPQKIWVIPAAADDFTYRKRMILVVGYPQPNGRKRESLLLDLAWGYDLSRFEFVLLGEQWEETAQKLIALGVSVKYSHVTTPDLIRQFYQVADVFLVTGYREGGPLPLLEALASGTRVLSPRFGYAADLLNDEDIYTTPADLMEKLHALFTRQVINHQLARMWSWDDYVAEYALLIGRLTGASVDLFPERGLSRYAQLLDVIDEIKPQSICEIGTWNGNRAVQMLQQASKYHPMNKLNYQGFDLFEQQTGEQFNRELSKLAYPLNVVQKWIDRTGANIYLKAGNTIETLQDDAPLDYDFYFVDGGHSETTIHNDGDYIKSCHFKVAIFDDYYHAGKPDGVGCNQFIDSLDRDRYDVTHLPARTLASDGREIGMVKVCRHTCTNASKDTDALSSTASVSWSYKGFAQNVTN